MKKNYNPICPFDKIDCKPNITGFMEMDGYLDCHNCHRYCNGVRETGAIPELSWIVETIKKLYTKWIQKK